MIVGNQHQLEVIFKNQSVRLSGTALWLSGTALFLSHLTMQCMSRSARMNEIEWDTYVIGVVNGIFWDYRSIEHR